MRHHNMTGEYSSRHQAYSVMSKAAAGSVSPDDNDFSPETFRKLSKMAAALSSEYSTAAALASRYADAVADARKLSMSDDTNPSSLDDVVNAKLDCSKLRVELDSQMRKIHRMEVKLNAQLAEPRKELGRVNYLLQEQTIEAQNATDPRAASDFNKNIRLLQARQAELVTTVTELNKRITEAYSSLGKTRPIEQGIMAKAGSAISGMAVGTGKAIGSLTSQVKTAAYAGGDEGRSVAYAITAGQYAAKTYRVAQYVTPVAGSAFIKAAKGTFIVGRTTVKVVCGGVSAANKILTGKINLGQQAKTQIKTLGRNAKGVIVRTVNNAKSAVLSVPAAAARLKKQIVKPFKAASNILTGRASIVLDKGTVARLLGAGAKGLGKGLFTGGLSAVRALPGLTGGGALSLNKVGSGFARLSDGSLEAKTLVAVLQTPQKAATAVKTTYKTAKTGIKAVRTVGHAGIRTAKGVKTGVRTMARIGKTAKNIGVKRMVKRVGRYAGKAAENAAAKLAQNAGKAALELVKKAAVKFLIPAMAIIVVIILVSTTAGTPLLAMGNFFGGIGAFFTGEGPLEEIDYREFLTNHYVGKRMSLIDRLYDEIEYRLTTPIDDINGPYHGVKFFDLKGSEFGFTLKTLSLARGQITDILDRQIPSAADLADLAMPMFQTIMVMDYELEASKDDMEEEAGKLFDLIVNFDGREGDKEFCLESICGNISTCLNPVLGAPHEAYTMDTCDSRHFECPGHMDYDYLPDPETGEEVLTEVIWHHDPGCEEHFDGCGGHFECGGHRIWYIHLKFEGVYPMEKRYFYDPIEALETKASRGSLTEDERKQLSFLYDSYELYINAIEVFASEFKMGGTSVDLSKVEFLTGSRPGNPEMMAIARQQIGIRGGKLYWSWFGFPSRVEWCACFASWVANEATDPKGQYLDDIIPIFALCENGIAGFKSRGVWYDGPCPDPAPGDFIFFDWDLTDSDPVDHVGLVVGFDENFVYTIEGNSSDAVRAKAYPLTSSCIVGYGQPLYY